MKQLTLDEAIAKREAAVDQVGESSSAWVAEAFAFLEAYCRSHEIVFCDDLWRAGLTPPREARALGPVMLRAVRAKLIARTGEYRPSTHSNLAQKPVWRSLVWAGAKVA